MSPRRVLPILCVVVAVLGASAVPSASLARTAAQRQVDPTADAPDTSGDTSDDPADPVDAGDGSLDACAADPADGTDMTDAGDLTDAGDPADARDATDATDSPDGTDSADGTDPTDGTDATDTGDDSSTADDCSGDSTAADATDQVDPADVAKLGQAGGIDVDIAVPGPGTVNTTLEAPTAGSASARAAKAHTKVLGRGHRVVKRAGTVTVHVRLTGQGKRALRSAAHALTLTLKTTIKLKTGSTIRRARSITVKPAKKPKHAAPHHKVKP